MKNIVFLNDGITTFHLKDISRKANQYQTYFNFISNKNINVDPQSPFMANSIEYETGLSYLSTYKSRNNLQENDLLICFYSGILKASSHNLTNLFVSGTKEKEINPCIAIISLNYLRWDILVKENDYKFQISSILHIIMSTIISAYTSLHPHNETHACLMDYNGTLASFNQKIKANFYLCGRKEEGCLSKIEKEPIYEHILKLCEVFRTRFRYEVNESSEETKINFNIEGFDNKDIIDAEIALRYIINTTIDNETRQGSMLFLLQLGRIKNEFSQGIITYDTYSSNYNRILHGIVEILVNQPPSR